jgi:membrane associated rhomboid family serine protease
MGIYDRDYQRTDPDDDAPGFHLGSSSWSWTTKLVLVMFGIYVIQLITAPARMMPGGGDGWFTETFSLHADLIKRPWMAFELLTYGFLHDPNDLKHIVFNMLGLWMFGRIVEQRYGPREYLAFFLVSVVFSGLCWLVSELAMRQQLVDASLIGASGGISAVLLLFCLNYPHQRVYLWGVLGLPAWVFAIVFIVGMNVAGASGHIQDNVAYIAHLGGALFAFIYYRMGWRILRWLPQGWKMPKIGRRPSLRVLDPAEEEEESTEEMVDQILRKIREHGQDSLTRGERRILEEASREYQKRRQ